MSVQAVLAPVFLQVALVFVLMIWMGRARYEVVRSGQVRVRDIALGEQNYPPRVTQVGNAFNNQFQLPMLFLVLVTLALIMHKADFVFVVLSWLFVLSRIIHTLIHVTSNHVGHRFTVYVVGAIVLLLMWGMFAVQMLITG